MDANRFDNLLRSLTTRGSRRGALAGLTSGLLATGPLALGNDNAAAKKKKKKCRGKKKCGKKCIPKSQCCVDADCPVGTGQTCQGGTCDCPAGQESSGGVCAPPPTCGRWVTKDECNGPSNCCGNYCFMFSYCDACSQSAHPCYDTSDCCPDSGLTCVGFVCTK